MPKIMDCSVEACAYNREKKCHALAINVGGSGPICDAFVSASAKCAQDDVLGGVGACKVKSCKFNDCLMCSAPGISVHTSDRQALCNTFEAR